MVKLILPLILGSLLLTITGNVPKRCQNRKLFSKLTLTPFKTDVSLRFHRKICLPLASLVIIKCTIIIPTSKIHEL
jgi:hypothetical protein